MDKEKEKEIIKKVVGLARLDSVLLKHSSSDTLVPPEMINAELVVLDINYSFNSAFDSENKLLFSFVAIEVKGNLKPEARQKLPKLELETDQVFFFESSFVARYYIGEKLDDNECEVFTRSNALFNVYPYLREHINTLSSKMGLPGIVLPLLKPYGQDEEK